MSNGDAAAYSSMLILAYTIKPLFAPIVEMYRTKKFFVLTTQVLVGFGFAAAALAMGMPNWMALMLPLFWAMSFIGATQDIASDGVYVTSLDTRAQSLYCGVQSLSWNIGPIVASGFLVYLSGRLHTDMFHHDPKVFGPEWIDAWRVIFFIVAAIIVLMALWHVRVMPEGARAENTPTSLRGAWDILWDSFVTFFQKRDVWKMIAFAFLFRTSIGLLEKIGPFFMVDAAAKGGLGLSNEQLGIVYGTYGLAAVLLGSLLGGMYVARRGLKRTLFVLCCAVNIPNATFLAMAILLPSSTAGHRRRRRHRKILLRLRLGRLHDLPDAAAGAGQVHHHPLRLRHRPDGPVQYGDGRAQRAPAGNDGLRRLFRVRDGGDHSVLPGDLVRALPPRRRDGQWNVRRQQYGRGERRCGGAGNPSRSLTSSLRRQGLPELRRCRQYLGSCLRRNDVMEPQWLISALRNGYGLTAPRPV
jgi:hypothetical protein